MTTTKFNPVQLHLLQLFAHELGQNELADIKALLADYFVRKADEEMQRLQQRNPTTQADLDALLNTHLRTPYKKP
ncbi:hypothetical protein J2I48_07020 [Fibrella sp. HMF5036]|uniref:Uncharacterized protein n=2 Tax=Fibrella aquatilis TaxID=2817059 RepID=A0A939G299_9BACT|nr:hypothetical protein [Fibrella aquatilis]